MSAGLVASGLIWTGLLLLAAWASWRRRWQRAAHDRVVELVDVKGVRQALAAGDETVAFDVPAFVQPGPALAGRWQFASPSVMAWVCPRRHPNGVSDGALLRFITEGRATVEHVLWTDPRKAGWESDLGGAVTAHRFICGAPRPRVSPEANGVVR